MFVPNASLAQLQRAFVRTTARRWSKSTIPIGSQPLDLTGNHRNLASIPSRFPERPVPSRERQWHHLPWARVDRARLQHRPPWALAGPAPLHRSSLLAARARIRRRHRSGLLAARARIRRHLQCGRRPQSLATAGPDRIRSRFRGPGERRADIPTIPEAPPTSARPVTALPTGVRPRPEIPCRLLLLRSVLPHRGYNKCRPPGSATLRHHNRASFPPEPFRPTGKP